MIKKLHALAISLYQKYPLLCLELAYILAGTMLGLLIHYIARAYISKINKKGNYVSDGGKIITSDSKTSREFIAKIIRYRGGQIAIATITGALSVAAAEKIAIAIIGTTVGLFGFLARHPEIIRDASIEGIRSKALKPIGISVAITAASILKNLTCSGPDILLAEAAETSNIDVESLEYQFDKAIDRTNFSNPSSTLLFITCIAGIMIFLYLNSEFKNYFFLLLRKLEQAAREGRISKQVYIAIKKMIKRKIPVVFFD